jgi:hypothetical protein
MYCSTANILSHSIKRKSDANFALLKIDDATCHRSAQSCEGGPHNVVPNVKPFLRQVLFGV